MSGYVDLHLHYVPGVDDGVRDRDDSLALLRGLRALGFIHCVATPHIRPGMFPNDRAPLEAAFAELAASTRSESGLPGLGLGAEHFVDDSFLPRIMANQALPYPGGKAVLIELPPSSFPLGLADVCFRLKSRGLVPVLAHPERYAPLYESTAPLDALLDAGVAPLLDLMSLTGRYGRAPQRAAERMLDDGVYVAACSDAHSSADVPRVEAAIDALLRRVGRDGRDELLVEGPKAILDGTLDV